MEKGGKFVKYNTILIQYNIQRLFSEKLCNTAGYFYESV